MAYQAVFKRYELKYLLTLAQKELLLDAMAPHMALDRYGRTTIRNLYLDTPNYRLIRRSIERPAYKEKIRLRSYNRAADGAEIFVELKKKYRSVVFKRRMTLPESSAVAWAAGIRPEGCASQIADEIDYFIHFYGQLRPAVFLSYDREAYYARDGSDFRITFDDTILCRQTDLTLDSEACGTPLLPEGKVLMEIKCAGGIPLWMTRILSEEHIYKTSFSKYGTAYQTLIYPQLKEEPYHAGNPV